MATNNLTRLTDSGVNNFGNLTWSLNDFAKGWLAYSMLTLVFCVALFTLLKKGYTIWTSLPACLFVTATLSLLLRLIVVDGTGMVSTKFVAVMWVLTALTAGVRVAIKEQ